MNNTKRLFSMLRLLLLRNGWKRAKYIQKKGIFKQMGNKCYYHPFKLPAEPHLISFGDNVFIGTNVSFYTHNMVNCVFNNEKLSQNLKLQTYFAPIDIGDNVFVGGGATILHGVTIGNNCIVAAGAVVVSNVEEGSIVAGVPAKVIGKYDDLKQRMIDYSVEFNNYYDNNLSEWENQKKYCWRNKNESVND